MSYVRLILKSSMAFHDVKWKSPSGSLTMAFLLAAAYKRTLSWFIAQAHILPSRVSWSAWDTMRAAFTAWFTICWRLGERKIALNDVASSRRIRRLSEERLMASIDGWKKAFPSTAQDWEVVKQTLRQFWCFAEENFLCLSQMSRVMFLGKFMSILKALLDAADEVNEIARKNFFRLRNFSAWGLEDEKNHTKKKERKTFHNLRNAYLLLKYSRMVLWVMSLE